jgi:protein O-mannosyl-transferase
MHGPSKTGPMSGRQRKQWMPTLLLPALTWLAYFPVLRCGFVSYDDPYYINEKVKSGLTTDGIRWAFTTFYFGNWHPLVWLSLQLDAQLYGASAWGFHLTNLILHTAGVLCLFMVLHWMTRELWPSALVAALLAVHPLNVESVAWISERKGILSSFFYMLSLCTYAFYVKRPGLRRYALVIFGMFLGLMAKPTLVTLPLVLLLLDFWPLRRLRIAGTSNSTGFPLARLVLEKAPLLAVAVAFAVIAWKAQASARALGSMTDFPVRDRIKNAIVSYAWYLWKALWPTDLSAFYPHPGSSLPAGPVAMALALLTAVTVLALWSTRKAPYVLVGWVWYVGTLVPVIGIFAQIGSHARADRYAYIPLIGLFIGVVWSARAAALRYPQRAILTCMAIGVLACLSVASCLQIHVWYDSASLWQHALRATDDNPVTYAGLGSSLLEQGRESEALNCYMKALRLRPDYALAHVSIGYILARRGNVAASLDHLQYAVRVDPNVPFGYRNLGLVLLIMGRKREAIAAFDNALRVDPLDEISRETLEEIAHSGQPERRRQ